MRMLLDTNVVVWLLLGAREQVPERVVAELETPSAEVWVSAASVWEIAIKRSLGKLEIESSWRQRLTQLDLDHLPITADHTAAVESLPWVHRDPFDRLLVAQALVEQATLVTPDRALDGYGVPTLWG